MRQIDIYSDGKVISTIYKMNRTKVAFIDDVYQQLDELRKQGYSNFELKEKESSNG